MSLSSLVDKIKNLFPYWNKTYFLTAKRRLGHESKGNIAWGLLLEFVFFYTLVELILKTILWFLGPFSAGLGDLPWFPLSYVVTTYSIAKGWPSVLSEWPGIFGINPGPDYLK